MGIAEPTEEPPAAGDQPGDAMAEGSTWAQRCATLEVELRELAGQITAAQAEFLAKLAAYDRLRGWGAWGARSAADWLSNHCGHGAYLARREVELAHALEELPVLRSAMQSGQMSMDKAAAVASIATADTEAELVELAAETTANQLARVMAAARRAMHPDEDKHSEANRRARYLDTFWDPDGMMGIRGRLPAEEGALVRKALEAAMTAARRDNAAAGFDGPLPADGDADARPDPTADADDPAGAARADALVALAGHYLDTGPLASTQGDHYLVVIHVDAEALIDDGDGRCHIEGGPALSIEVARRLACGASLVWLADDCDGNPVAVSPKTKDIPQAVRRAVRARDGGCVFPTGTGGTCGRAAEHSHVHHVELRSQGGAHSIANCHTLCSYHHHLVHEGGFTMAAGPGGRLEFRRPNGDLIANDRPTLFDDHPPERLNRPLQPDIAWARSNGERMDLGMAVDAVLGILDKRQTDP